MTEKNALLWYLKPFDGFPDPQSEAEVNKKVQKSLNQSSVTRKKRGNYKTYTATQHSQIGKYNCLYGAAAAT